MSEFDQLESLYKYLEDHALDNPFGADIAELFEQLKRSAAHGLSEQDLLVCDWEASVFRVHFVEGEPIRDDLTKNSDQAFHNHLKYRVKQTENPLLKAYYSHSLWIIPATKHSDHAKTAIASYLELVKIFEKKTLEIPEEFFCFHLERAVGNAFFLGYQARFRFDEIKSDVIRLVIEFNFTNPASFNLRRDLIRLMLDSRKKFKKEDWKGVPQVCWRLAQEMVGGEQLELAIEALELGEEIDNKIGLRTHDWITAKGCYHEKLISKYPNTPNPMIHCQEAIMAYKQAKKWDKVRELEQKYREIGTAIPVATFTEEIDLTEHQEKCKRLASTMSQQSSEQIIFFLMNSTDLLPNYSKLLEAVNSERQEAHIIDMLATELMDSRGHAIQHFSTPDELEYLRILNHYGPHLELDLVLLEEIITASFRASKITGDILLKFLEEHTWLGRNQVSAQPGGQEIRYRWLDLIAPSVHQYFRNLQRLVEGIGQNSDWVLCVDSLTLKFEGLVRNFETYGITTFYITTDFKGRQISKEKDLNGLLHEEGLKNLISQDDLVFFRFLLTEHVGYNLRNNIAHTLILSPESYSRGYATLLILAPLRLARYPLGN